MLYFSLSTRKQFQLLLIRLNVHQIAGGPVPSPRSIGLEWNVPQESLSFPVELINYSNHPGFRRDLIGRLLTGLQMEEETSEEMQIIISRRFAQVESGISFVRSYLWNFIATENTREGPGFFSDDYWW